MAWVPGLFTACHSRAHLAQLTAHCAGDSVQRSARHEPTQRTPAQGRLAVGRARGMAHGAEKFHQPKLESPLKPKVRQAALGARRGQRLSAFLEPSPAEWGAGLSLQVSLSPLPCGL